MPLHLKMIGVEDTFLVLLKMKVSVAYWNISPISFVKGNATTEWGGRLFYSLLLAGSNVGI